MKCISLPVVNLHFLVQKYVVANVLCRMGNYMKWAIFPDFSLFSQKRLKSSVSKIIGLLHHSLTCVASVGNKLAPF